MVDITERLRLCATDFVFGDTAVAALKNSQSLRDQLAHREAQLVVLRDATMPLVRHRHATNDGEYRAAEQAIAATNDMSGYILCEMEPVAFIATHDAGIKGGTYRKLTWNSTGSDWAHGFEPLYRAARRPECE